MIPEENLAGFVLSQKGIGLSYAKNNNGLYSVIKIAAIDGNLEAKKHSRTQFASVCKIEKEIDRIIRMFAPEYYRITVEAINKWAVTNKLINLNTEENGIIQQETKEG